MAAAVFIVEALRALVTSELELEARRGVYRFALRSPQALQRVMPQRHFGVCVVPQAVHCGWALPSSRRCLARRLAME